jgi:hypothetical protein
LIDPNSSGNVGFFKEWEVPIQVQHFGFTEYIALAMLKTT